MAAHDELLRLLTGHVGGPLGGSALVPPQGMHAQPWYQLPHLPWLAGKPEYAQRRGYAYGTDAQRNDYTFQRTSPQDEWRLYTGNQYVGPLSRYLQQPPGLHVIGR